MALSRYQRYCLNLQGYAQLSDEAKGRIDLAQRFAPAVCTVLALATLVTQSVPLAIVAAVLGYWAALFRNHPVALLYRWVVQPLFRAPDLGADPTPRRFACGMAATLLLVGAVAWQLGATELGIVFVGLVFLASLAVVVADFCVGSFFYWLLVRRQVFRGRAQ